jgi:hypothetical protein
MRGPDTALTLANSSDARGFHTTSASFSTAGRLDPRSVVDPMESDHLQIILIDPARPLDDLPPVGNGPPLASG